MIKLWISFSVCSPYSQNTPHAECLHISSLFSWNSIVLSYCLYQSAKVQKEKLIKQKCVCIYIYSISLVNLQQWNSWIMNVFAKLLAAVLLINVWTIRQFIRLWAKKSVSQSLMPCCSALSGLMEQLNWNSAANDLGSKPTHVITATASPLQAFVDFTTSSKINPAQCLSLVNILSQWICMHVLGYCVLLEYMILKDKLG